MAHDVFVSHAHKDKSIADVICEKLESVGVRCWMAARDISASEDWTTATRTAIRSSRVMVLVLSENANAAPHIKREIAHAFYTRRIIIPLRLADTLPRRDFLFYLGKVRWINAFNPPAEQHLEALEVRIKDLIRDSGVCKAIPVRGAIKTRSTLDCVNSWIGSLQASHSRAVEILKRVAVAAFLVLAMFLFFLLSRQSKHEALLVEGNTAGAKPLVQKALQDTPSITPAEQPPSVSPSARPDVDLKAAGEAERLAARDSEIVNSVQEEPTRKINHREGHRGKRRAKGHDGKPGASEGSRFTKIKNQREPVEALLATPREPNGEQDAHKARGKADLATMQNSALEAQLRKPQEDAPPAHEDAGLVDSQPEFGQIQPLNPSQNAKPTTSTQRLDASVRSDRP
jgi:hypothetical protein